VNVSPNRARRGLQSKKKGENRTCDTSNAKESQEIMFANLRLKRAAEKPETRTSSGIEKHIMRKNEMSF